MSTVPKRSICQIRPKSGGPQYSPQRDLAYLYGPALGEALAFLSPNVLDDFHRGLMDHGHEYVAESLCTVEDLCAAISAFMQAHDLFTGAPGDGDRYGTPQEALEAAGFFKTKPLAQMMIYEKLGAVLTGGFFVACRDVTGFYDVPPPEVAMAEMLGAGRALCNQMSGVPSFPERLDAELTTANARYQQAAKSVVLHVQERDMLSRRFAEERKAHQETAAELKAWKERPLWRRVLNRAPAV